MTKGYCAVKFILALAIAYVITGLTIIIAAFFTYKLSLADTVIDVLVKVIYIVSTFVGGFYFCHKVKGKRLLCGCLLGVAYCMVIFMIDIMVSGVGNVFSKEMLSPLGLCVLGGIIGGFLG